MRLRPDQDALDFGAGVGQLLEQQCDAEALRAAWDSADGRVPGLWKRLADIGVTGLTVPEEHGGAGMDLTWALPMLTAVGRAAAPEPLVETIAAARIVAAAGGAVASEWLPKVADGSAVLLADDEAVWALPAAAVSVQQLPSVDTGVRLATVEWSRADAVARIDSQVGESAYEWAVVATSAQLVGLAEAMLDMAVRYALQREQFGKPIGSFQAIKHQLADVYVGVAFARPLVNRAAWSVTRSLPSQARDASHAKHVASVAAGRAARTALQVHGGIGYTFEHDLHMWLKRTWTLSALWGNERWHKDRVARAVLGEGTTRVP